MTENINTIVLALYVPPFLAYSIYCSIKFKQFCMAVAKVENRAIEMADIRTDDGGLNKFELEVFYRLAGGRKNFSPDGELQDTAAKLRKTMMISFALTFLLIGFLVWRFG